MSQVLVLRKDLETNTISVSIDDEKFKYILCLLTNTQLVKGLLLNPPPPPHPIPRSLREDHTNDDMFSLKWFSV